MKTIVILPTYNEAKNILQMLERVLSLGNPDVTCLVVDDNSPDGTADIVRKFQKTHQGVALLVREKKEGLGRAYVAAFAEARKLGAKRIVTMDADTSHDPGVIPTMISLLASADCVIGSRYCSGGSIKNWHMIRRWVSRFGNAYARFVLRLPIHDLTTGYMCFSIHALDVLRDADLASNGYVILIELKYRMHIAGLRMKETPIVFTERAAGDSKFNIRIFWEACMQVLRLRKRFPRKI